MQPREKLQEKGVDSLTDRELVSILVGTGTKGVSHKRLAKKLLRKLRENISDSVQLERGILDVSGIGAAKYARIVAGIELGRRLYGLHDSKVHKIMTTDGAVEFFADMESLKQEQVRIALLNARFEVLSSKTVAVGKGNSAIVSPKDILRYALEVNAVYVVVAHNHPSGDPEPSKEDIASTRRIREACDLVGIKMLDHIVIASNGWSAIPVSL